MKEVSSRDEPPVHMDHLDMVRHIVCPRIRTLLKTVIHNMMPIFLMKSSSTPSNDQDEYVDLLVDSRKIFELSAIQKWSFWSIFAYS